MARCTCRTASRAIASANMLLLYTLQSMRVLLAAICSDGKKDGRRQRPAVQPSASRECFEYAISGWYRNNAFPMVWALYRLRVHFLPNTVRLRVDTGHSVNWIKTSERQGNTARYACCNIAIYLARENRQRSSLGSERNKARFILKTDFVSAEQSITEQSMVPQSSYVSANLTISS